MNKFKSLGARQQNGLSQGWANFLIKHI